jgi:single-strand DNA-binding protein
MNRVILTGNVVKDAELTETKGGGKRCIFSLAVREKKPGAEKAEVNYVPVVAWANFAEAVAKYAKKGERLLIDGALNVRTYESDGRKHYVTEIVAERFEYLGKLGSDKEETTEGE